MNFAQLLTALSMETRLDLQAAVAAGGCTIQFDKNVELSIESDADTGQVQLYVVVAEPPVVNRETFFAALLQLHLFGVATGGGVFGFDPQQGRVLFFKTLDLALLDEAAALKQIEVFVNQAEHWRARLLDVTSTLVPAAVEPTSGGFSMQRV